MSRASRRQKTEHQLRLLEEQFTENLIVALKKCASGQWGMFTPGFFLKSKVKDHPLLGQGDEIMRLRRELGIAEDFPLFQRYLFYRQLRSSNTAGEPKLALQFLTEIGVEPDNDGHL
jgi:hypothetical protein